MKIFLLPDELIDNIFSYIENIYIENKKKLIRKITFLKYNYNFDIYFNRTDLPFYKHVLLNNKSNYYKS
tara:strand:- start:456 stop:662 length:207 start_codon:yes stop_codon:yes gene_type:complete